MDGERLNKVLKLHKEWLYDNSRGGRAELQDSNLQDVNLQDVNLRGADLRRANLKGADLRRANLRYVDLRRADLRYVDLRRADLKGADLQYANLRYANLKGANLQDANLKGANLDFSCLPLWCGGLNFKIDENQAKQLMYHVINLMQYNELDVNKVVKKQMFKWLEDSHIVTEHNLPILRSDEE